MKLRASGATPNLVRRGSSPSVGHKSLEACSVPRLPLGHARAGLCLWGEQRHMPYAAMVSPPGFAGFAWVCKRWQDVRSAEVGARRNSQDAEPAQKLELRHDWLKTSIG